MLGKGNYLGTRRLVIEDGAGPLHGQRPPAQGPQQGRQVNGILATLVGPSRILVDETTPVKQVGTGSNQKPTPPEPPAEFQHEGRPAFRARIIRATHHG